MFFENLIKLRLLYYFNLRKSTKNIIKIKKKTHFDRKIKFDDPRRSVEHGEKVNY